MGTIFRVDSTHTGPTSPDTLLREKTVRLHLSGSIASQVLSAFAAILIGPAALAGPVGSAQPPNPFVYELVKDRLQSLRTTLTVGGDGLVYGTSEGRAFRIDDGGTMTTLHTFVDEGTPSPLVAGADGSVYGITDYAAAGTTIPCCTFFRISAEGTYTPFVVSLPSWVSSNFVRGGDGAFYAALAPRHQGMIWVFPGGVAKIKTDGTFSLLGGHLGVETPAIPLAAGSDGAVYGTRDEMSGLLRVGSIVRWDAAGNDRAIHAYTDAEARGGQPNGFTLGSDNQLYAVTPYAGVGGGAAFRFDTAGNVTLLREFSFDDGAYPYAPMTLGSDGAMYGVAEFGGANAGGTVFRIDPAGAFSTIYSFDWTNGGYPMHSLVLAKNGSLYGTSQFGIPGPAILRVEPPGTVASYPVLPNDIWPGSPLVQGIDCAFYGVGEYWDDQTSNYDTAIYRVFEGQLCQQIDFPPLPDRTLGSPPFTVDATASSGLPVSLRVRGRCAIRGDRVRLTGVGACTVTAYQDGDARFGPAEDVWRTFRIEPPGRALGRRRGG